MTINFRTSVFETNSSSTHSLSLSKISSSSLYQTIIPEDGIISLAGGEFGWKWEKFNDALTKANYCAVYALNFNDKMDLLKKVVTEHTGAKEIQILATLDFDSKQYWSYIDHQSDAVPSDIFSSEDELKNFIFNSNSWLFLGNDNGSPPPNFYDKKPLKYRWELKIDGQPLTAKWLKKPKQQELEDAFDSLFERDSRVSYSNGKFFEFIHPMKLESGTFSSLDHLKFGFIRLYKLNHKYDEHNKNISSIKEFLDVKFELTKIKSH